LVRHVGHAKSDFPLGTHLAVIGWGDPSGVGLIPSYFPNCPREPVVMNKSTRVVITTEEVSETVKILEEEPEERLVRLIRTTRKKKSEISKGEKEEITGTDKDIRTVKLWKLKEYLFRLGLREVVVARMRRWGMTWFLQFVAASSQGANLLNGELLKYARKDITSGGNMTVSLKREERENRQKIESEGFFLRFRKAVDDCYQRLMDAIRTAEGQAPAAAPEVTPSVEDVSLDEIVENLERDLFEDKTPKYVRRRNESDEAYNARSTQEFQKEMDYHKWLQTVQTTGKRRKVIKRTVIEYDPVKQKDFVYVEFDTT